MNDTLPVPAQLRFAKMPRGESFTDPANMSPENRAEWLRREAELMAQLQREIDGDEDMEPHKRVSNRGRTPGTPGTLTARLLALMWSEPERWWTQEELRRALATQAKLLPVLRRLIRRGKVRQDYSGLYPVVWRVEGER